MFRVLRYTTVRKALLPQEEYMQLTFTNVLAFASWVAIIAVGFGPEIVSLIK